MPRTHGRHTPAFLLLLLADGPSYGALLFNRLKAELPFCLSDSAIVYRSLKQMERQRLVTGRWVHADSGQPRRWYSLTSRGERALRDYAQDIRRRRANLQFFLDRYDAIQVKP